jgi:hypothetical protein
LVTEKYSGVGGGGILMQTHNLQTSDTWIEIEVGIEARRNAQL